MTPPQINEQYQINALVEIDREKVEYSFPS